MSRTSRLLLLAAALAACAPASAGDRPRREALLSDAPRPRDRDCRVAVHPRQLPSAAELVDSAGLAAAAAGAWRAAGGPAGHVLLGLRYDRDGVNVRRAVIEHSVSPALADTLQALTFAHRRVAASGEREWSVRLRMDLGEQPRLRVGRSQVCAPALRESMDGAFSSIASRGWGDVRDASPAPSAADPTMVWLRVSVDAGGNVVDARVERGSMRHGRDTRTMAALRGLDFVPATEDGHPVPGELSIRLRVR